MSSMKLLNNVALSVNLQGECQLETAECEVYKEGAARSICSVPVRGMAVPTIGAWSGLGCGLLVIGLDG